MMFPYSGLNASDGEWCRLPSYQPNCPSRPKATEHPRVQYGTDQTGRLWPGSCLWLLYGSHVSGKCSTVPDIYMALMLMLNVQ